MNCEVLMPYFTQFVEVCTLSSQNADGAGVGEAFASIGKEK